MHPKRGSTGPAPRSWRGWVVDQTHSRQAARYGRWALNSGQNMPVAPGHHLLPHETRSASLILERQRTHRTSAILRMEQNYGPEGIALWAAGMATVLPGMLLVVLGFASLVPSGSHPWLLTLVNWLYGIGVILILLGSIRYFKCNRAGRTFRGGRAFVK